MGAGRDGWIVDPGGTRCGRSGSGAYFTSRPTIGRIETSPGLSMRVLSYFTLSIAKLSG